MIRPIASAILFIFVASSACAAVNEGSIAGQVTEATSGELLAGITVSVTGPSLQGEQIEITNTSGQYVITELPPGEYTVRASRWRPTGPWPSTRPSTRRLRRLPTERRRSRLIGESVLRPPVRAAWTPSSRR